MSRPDSTAAAALDAQVVRPVFVAWLDVLGDPLRANTSGHDMPFSGTGDTDLDGYTFHGVDPTFVDIGEVKFREGGSDSLTAKISGIVGLDSDLLDTIGTTDNWRGRTARLWRVIRDEFGTQAGAIQPYYTGYMSTLDMIAAANGQTLTVTIEGYLAAFTAASNRSYLDQDSFDPGDLSARAAVAIANGVSGTALVSNTVTAPFGYDRFSGRLENFA